MKIAFFGTGEFSKNILKYIVESSDIEVDVVISQPDKPVGRKKILTFTPVKLYANEKGLKIFQPTFLKDNNCFFDKIKGYDFIIVVAYGKIVPKEVLEAPKYGCINIHGSILPKYRGASPIQEAIKNGNKETGLTIMYMSKGMDEGDILAIKRINIDKLDKTENIFKKFEEIGPKLLIDTLGGILNGTIKGQKQDENKATYCSKISKEDGKVNFNTDNGIQIFNKYKAYYNWPGIFIYYNNKKLNLENIEIIDNNSESNNIGKTIKIDKKNIGIICKDKKIIILKQIKLEGKKSMDILSFINGDKDFLHYNFK